MDFHPYTDLLPPMTPEQYAGLVEDIGANGLREPITVYKGCILDGVHRWLALQELAEQGHKIEPQFREFEGTDKEAYRYVLSMNVHRRHLEYSQRAGLAAQCKRFLQESGEVKPGNPELKANSADFGGIQGEARDIAAREFHVGHTGVDEAERVMDEAPDLFGVMVDGGITLREAQREVRDRQRRERREEIEATPLPAGKYRVIYADPPWPYQSTGLDQYGPAERHYPTMKLQEICDLPIADMVADEAVLFLWAPSPMLEVAFQVIRAWGFEYKASFVWDKVRHNYGHYNSVRHEFLLVATKGSCLPGSSKLEDSVVTLERTDKHSEKPEAFRQLIERLYLEGPRVELFARTAAPGWDGWGDEYNADKARDRD